MSVGAHLLGLGMGFLYSTFFEWILHKHIMHTPNRVNYSYQAHDQVHHKVFRFDKSYELQSENDARIVPMAWWNYPLLLTVNLPVIFGLQWLIGLPTAGGMIVSMTFYYATYEYFHYCYHVPKNRWFEKLGVYQSVKEHHLLHHKFKFKNLNVVFPVADYILGTRVTRANPRDDDVLTLGKDLKAES